MIFLFKTLRGKLLFGSISSVILINIVFTIFISVFLEDTLRSNIIDEITNVRKFAVNAIKRTEITGESKWNILNNINDASNLYVSIVNKEGEICENVGLLLKEGEIEEVLKESKNLHSVIRFKNIEKSYCITYSYPFSLNDEFYGNLIIQKDYIEKYNENIRAIQIIVSGQILIVIILIMTISTIINKVTKPINNLSKLMNSFVENINSNDICISSNDEIGNLYRSYNMMKNQIKDQLEIIILEKENIERLQKSSTEFFNNATHELKTPITAISLYSQILRDTDLKELDREFLNRATNRIILESNKMKVLVEKILDVSKGGLCINKVKSYFSLNELIEEIIEDFEIRVKESESVINTKLQNIFIYSVLEDIEQIITNLLDNSIKYNKGRLIEINLYKKDDSVIFDISNKCGEFPEEIKDRLLEPFIKYNTYSDISREVSSSGLGLYLCKELAIENNSELIYLKQDDTIKFTLKVKNSNNPKVGCY